MADVRTDGRIERGDRTRRLILRRTVDIASVEGLEGLSLGRLATELGLSKSGVFALFGSKEDLQLATVRAAGRIFLDHVVVPVAELAPGTDRVWRLCTGWLAYSRDRVFRGGCFFAFVSAEYASREGRVRDAVAAARAEWHSFLERTLSEARQAGELSRDADVPQLAFEIAALLEAANTASVLDGDPSGYGKAASGILSRLRASATAAARLPSEV
ncbi:TetR/AcrR family transcriptional regulator [Streptomyces zhihengii]|uniref:TetR/AcrR family transcriptional regulator n=1 Tax=Streptomyces zhihengii TaxID=1818004 RepID=A0ABS2UL32_9ACTN|nr:TetR/AcrR family transcriptional regulator [Streptomyces zhihengii]MBM9618008.1 TetR/AcrR family transcriptional regulator [Streptomyces zhihengii]